jgi:sortase B
MARLSFEEAATIGLRQNTLSRALLVLGIALILAAGAIVGSLIYGYLDAQNRYREIATVSGLEVPLLGDVVDPDLPLENLSFDWDALRASNPDIVAWVIVPGTHVNYPIVQGENNSYYLYHLFDSSSSGAGTVFLDFEGSADFSGKNNIVYGHNMLDGSMFSDIMMFMQQDFFNEHSVVYLATPQLNRELKPLATLRMDENAPLRQFGFADDIAFDQYLGDMLSRAVVSDYDLAAKMPGVDKLYSFVTCDTLDFSVRIILSCEEVRSVVPANAKP